MRFETVKTGNTPETIVECLASIYNMERGRRGGYRVSVVYGSGRSQVSVGDDLDLANSSTYKTLKKRWWDLCKYDKDQLRLPFANFRPAEIGHIDWRSSRNRFTLQIKFVDIEGANRHTEVKFASRDGLRGGGNSIKAIRVHRCIREPLDRSDGSFRVERRTQRRYTDEECETLVRRALYEDGVAVTADGSLRNNRSGQFIGSDFSVQRRDDLNMPPHDPNERYYTGRNFIGRLSMLNGATFEFSAGQDLSWAAESLSGYDPETGNPDVFIGRFRVDGTSRTLEIRQAEDRMIRVGCMPADYINAERDSEYRPSTIRHRDAVDAIVHAMTPDREGINDDEVVS